MKVEEIEKLLAEFYEGKTTESQEHELRSYFETRDVPEHLFVDKKLFLSFGWEEEIPVPGRLEDKLISIIDAESKKEKLLFGRNRTKKNRWWLAGIAASVIILVGLGHTVLNMKGHHGPKDTFTNPQEAYAAMQSALIEVSANLNQGFDQLAETRREIKSINKEIINEIE